MHPNCAASKSGIVSNASDRVHWQATMGNDCTPSPLTGFDGLYLPRRDQTKHCWEGSKSRWAAPLPCTCVTCFELTIPRVCHRFSFDILEDARISFLTRTRNSLAPNFLLAILPSEFLPWGKSPSNNVYKHVSAEDIPHPGKEVWGWKSVSVSKRSFETNIEAGAE